MKQCGVCKSEEGHVETCPLAPAIRDIEPSLESELDLGHLNPAADLVLSLCSLNQSVLSQVERNRLQRVVHQHMTAIQTVANALRQEGFFALATCADDLLYEYDTLDGKFPQN